MTDNSTTNITAEEINQGEVVADWEDEYDVAWRITNKSNEYILQYKSPSAEKWEAKKRWNLDDLNVEISGEKHTLSVFIEHNEGTTKVSENKYNTHEDVFGEGKKLLKSIETLEVVPSIYDFYVHIEFNSNNSDGSSSMKLHLQNEVEETQEDDGTLLSHLPQEIKEAEELDYEALAEEIGRHTMNYTLPTTPDGDNENWLDELELCQDVARYIIDGGTIDTDKVIVTD